MLARWMSKAVSAPSDPGYRPEIDGLRAVAVIAVLIFHISPSTMSGGFIGVDVFFVISGYLITGILLRGLQTENFRFSDFYIRRARRIFPALVVVLTAILALGWYAFLSNEFTQLARHAAAGAGFVSNFLLLSEVGYFDAAGERKPLLHLWSLGVEEQFYLIWPLILCLYTKKSRTFPATVAVIGIVVTITFRWHHLAGGNDPSALYTTTVARLDSILIGALLAIWRIPVARALHRAGATWLLFGASIALIGLLIIGNRTMFLNTYWAFSAFACCSAAFILLSLIAKENHPVRRFLRLRPMIYMGSISYGLYIYHYPIFAALETLRIPGNTSNLVWVTTLKATLSAATASVSWHFLEQPMIEWRRHLFK